jgi:hypothetical protein
VEPYPRGDNGGEQTDRRETQGWECGKHASQHPAQAQVSANLRKHGRDSDCGWPKVERKGRNGDQQKDPS